MPYALELALDDRAARAVRRAWEELADAGITYMARSGARPHVSLGIWDTIDRVAFEAELARFAVRIAGRTPLPLESRLVEVGLIEFRPVRQLASRALGRR
jgi:hypothetical protein